MIPLNASSKSIFGIFFVSSVFGNFNTFIFDPSMAGQHFMIRMNGVEMPVFFALWCILDLSRTGSMSLRLPRIDIRSKSSLVLRGGFKNMFGEEQCRNFSRGEAGALKQIWM